MAGAGLERWLRAFGFERNPFAYREAGADPDLNRYFVTPSYFDQVLGDSKACQTAIVFAPRGGGKTALRVMVDYHCREGLTPERILSVPYTDFTPVVEAVNHDLSLVTPWLHTVEVLCRATAALIEELEDNLEAALAVLSPAQRIHLAWYLRLFGKYLKPQQVAAVSQAGLNLRLEATQDRLGFLRQSQEELPVVVGDMLVSRKGLPPATLLEEFSELITLLGFPAMYVLVDRLDEFPLTAANHEAMLMLIEPLLADLTLMNLRQVAFKCFFPDMLKAKILAMPTIRPDRLAIRHVEWTDQALLEVLHRRLEAFSNYSTLDELCVRELRGRIEPEMISMAKGSPRNLVRLGELLLSEHTRLPVLDSEVEWFITTTAWQAAQQQFIQQMRVQAAAVQVAVDTLAPAQPLIAEEAAIDAILEQVRTQFPAPVAMVCRDFLIQPIAERRFKRMLDLVEVTMHFSLFLLLGVYRTWLPQHTSVARPPDHVLGHKGREMSLGRAMAALSRLGGALAARGNKWGRWVQRSCNNNRSQLNYFVELRNRYAHGALESSQAVLKSLQSSEEPLAVLFRGFSFLKECQLLWVEHLRKEGGFFIHRARVCVGDHPNFPWAEVAATVPLECEQLWSMIGEEIVPMHPLVLWTWCEACNQNEIFLYSRRVGEKLEYLSYATGHILTIEALTDEMAAVWESTPVSAPAEKQQ